MKVILAAVCLAALTMPAAAADFTALHLTVDVAAPLGQTWSRIGDYCAVKDWLGYPCQITAGDGGVGTIRHLTGAPNGTVDEIMTAKTRYSYGYLVLGSPVDLHGGLSADAIDAGHTRLTYTVLYDQTSLATAADKAAARDRRTGVFNSALANMKKIAEKP